jgi:hypothetical protein
VIFLGWGVKHWEPKLVNNINDQTVGDTFEEKEVYLCVISFSKERFRKIKQMIEPWNTWKNTYRASCVRSKV